MYEISFEGEGPSLREVHEHLASEEGVTFRQQYSGQYAAAVAASGFVRFMLPPKVEPSVEGLRAIEDTFGLRAYFGPGEEAGVALSGMAVYYQALGPVLPVRSELSTAG